MTDGDRPVRAWIDPYTGSQEPAGGSHWAGGDGTERAITEMVALAGLLTGSTTSIVLRQCANEEVTDWCRAAAGGDSVATRSLVLLSAALATGTSFIAASDRLGDMTRRGGMPLVVVAAARLADCHIVQRWLTYTTPETEEAIDRSAERLQLIDLACRLADRGSLAVDLLTVFTDRFRGSAACFALHILDLCTQVPDGFADKLAWTLARDWDGDPRDIPAAVEALLSSATAST